ncbi:MAG TPA: hypothetical protein VH143_31645 [Kofleriaceae bacterium]|jgi:hypothetical protein|nr:hypothetical protein [Kofleriaceae bacterium]
MRVVWLVLATLVARTAFGSPVPPLASSVSIGQLWFRDPACRAAFPDASEVFGGKLDQLDACLAQLDLQPSDRAEPLDDHAAYTYGPGFELEIELADGKLEAISYLLAGRPTISAVALEQLRLGGGLALARGHAWAEVCIDQLGGVTSHAIREASSPATARAADAAIAQWDFAPFRIGARAVSVCALEELRAATSLEDPLPITPPGDELVIASSQLVRIAGDKYIVPGDVDKVQMMRNGWDRIEPAIELCIDPDGAPERVVMLHSSGLAGYDAKIQYSMESWRFRPYRDGEHAVGVCTVVHFVYTQM